MKKNRLAFASVKDIPKIKAELRAKVPDVTPKEFYRYRFSIDEAIKRELCDAGCHESVNFLNRLLTIEEEQERNKFAKGLKLKNSQHVLKLLMTHLKDAELEDREDIKALTLLDLARKLQNLNSSFYWVVDQIFTLAVFASTKVKIDGGYIEALTRYYYSQFCLKQLMKLEKAFEHGEKAYELSLGRPSWLINETKVSLVNEILKLFNEVLLKQAKSLINTDLTKAQCMALRAINIAKELDEASTIAKCCYTYGMVLTYQSQHIKAIESLMSGLEQATKVHNDSLVCEGYYELAVTYKALNNFPNAERYILLTIRVSDKPELEVWYATALSLSAELCLMKGDFDDVIKKSVAAQAVFKRLGMQQKVKEANFLIALAKAQKMFPAFVASVTAGEHNVNEVYNLMCWKLSRHFASPLVDDSSNDKHNRGKNNSINKLKQNQMLTLTMEEEEEEGENDAGMEEENMFEGSKISEE